MRLEIKREKLTSFWEKKNAVLVLSLLLAIFVAFLIHLTFNLQINIAPDEAFHYSISQSFAKTLGVPYETPVSLERGLFIRQNPYFAYWIYGRGLNLFSLIKPNATDWQQLVFLRLINACFSLGTVIYTYLFSKELSQNKWWSLLPVFLLTNTIMFVVLSSGVSYDNLANFFSVLSLYFLLRVIKRKEFIKNSLVMLLSLCLGMLMKYTVVPLAVGMIIIWIIFIITKRPPIEIKQLKLGKNILLMIVIAVLIGFNLSIYGVNLIKFQSLIPSCPDNYSEAFCRNSPFLRVYYNLRLPEKLTILSAVKQGYPEPLRYVFDTWIRAMFQKTYGIMGGKNYFPAVTVYFQMLFYWTILLLFRYFKKSSFKIYSFIGIVLFYSLVLLIKNYTIELDYGFIQVAHQGRYIFPVITVIYCLLSYGLMKVPNKILKFATLAVTIVLFIYGGPLKFITHYRPVFASWFIN